MRSREQEDSLWVVSDDAEFCEHVREVLEDQLLPIRVIARDGVMKQGFWRETEVLPGAVLLDPDEDLDWAASVLRDIKRAHIRSPVIVAAREMDKDFGTKIVSEGVSYLLLRDFEPRELREAATGLIRQSRHPLH